MCQTNTEHDVYKWLEWTILDTRLILSVKTIHVDLKHTNTYTWFKTQTRAVELERNPKFIRNSYINHRTSCWNREDRFRACMFLLKKSKPRRHVTALHIYKLFTIHFNIYFHSVTSMFVSTIDHIHREQVPL